MGVSLQTGFNDLKKIKFYLNGKLIKCCNNCKTNESIGYVKEENSNKVFFSFSIPFENIKIGDKFKVIYDDEVAIYSITSNSFKYPELNISGIDKLNWEFSFVNDATVIILE